MAGIELIALAGKPFSGKTSVARVLANEYGYQLLNYSDFLKEITCAAVNRWRREKLTVEEIHANKHLYRDLLYQFGHAIGFDGGEFIHHLMERWNYDKAVLDNIRTVEQARAIKRYGFTLVELVVAPYAQRIRAQQLGVTEDHLDQLPLLPIQQGLRGTGEVDIEIEPAVRHWTPKDIACYLATGEAIEKAVV